MNARRRGRGTRAGNGSGRAGPIAACVLVVAAAAGAIAVDQGASEPAAPRALASRTLDGPTVPSRSAVSAAWYCAEGTSTADGRADETIIIGNLAKHPIDVAITVMPGSDVPPVVRRRRVDALAQERVLVSDVVATPEPGVVVEVIGGQAVVEHELRSRNDIAVGPCARAPSQQWYFAAGTTQRGAEEWLALFNPFGDDAIVDISFLTDAGFQAPGSTQSFVVPRRSRVSLPVHEQVRRQDAVAVAVQARTGRIVVERTLRFDGTDARSGLAVSLGVTGSAQRWRSPSGDAQAGAAQSVAVANFALLPTKVEVRVRLDGPAVLPPETVDVPARGVVLVDLAGKIPANSGYALDLRTTGRGHVVVETFGVWAAPSTVAGVATSPASVTTADRWALAVGRTEEQGDAVVTALNVSGRPLTVQLYAYTAGDPNSPASAPAQAVPPGERAIFRTFELGIRPDMVLVVGADGPIVVGRQVLGANGAGVSLSPGVPFVPG